MFNINSGSSPGYMSSLVTPCNQIQSRTNESIRINKNDNDFAMQIDKDCLHPTISDLVVADFSTIINARPIWPTNPERIVPNDRGGGGLHPAYP